MNARFFRCCLFAGFSAVFLVGVTQAAPVTSALFMNQLNNLHDQDSEAIFNSSGTQITASDPNGGTVQSGDYLLAVFQVETDNSFLFPRQTHTLGGGTTDLLTGISLLQLSSVTQISTSSNYSYSFVAPSSAAWQTITGLTSIPNGTILSTYDNSSNTNPNNAATMSSAVTDAGPGLSGNQLLWNLGFTGTDNMSGSTVLSVNPNASAGEGWLFSQLNGAPNSVAGLESAIANGGSFSFRGGLNVLSSGSLVNGITLAPTTDFNGNTLAPGDPMPQVIIAGSLADNGVNSVPGALPSDTNAYIDPVPEPSSMLLMGIGVGSFALVGFSRRKKLALAA